MYCASLSGPDLLQDGVLLRLEDSFQRQVHEGGTELVQIPLQDREILFDRRLVRVDGREAATECAKSLKMGDTVPSVIEQRVGVVLVDRVPHGVVIAVHLD